MSFHNAAVTKGVMLALGVGSLAVGVFDVKHYFHLQLTPHIFKYHQYWRLVTQNLIFGTSSDLLLSQILLFNMGVNIERTFGSRKYASFLIVTTGLSTALLFLALLSLHQFGLNYIPPGPIAMVFAILYQHYRIVPPTYHFRLSYLEVSNKAFMYILALQLLISQPPSTILSAVIGTLVGQLYRSDMVGLKRFRISPTTERLARNYVSPLIGSTRPTRSSNLAFPPERDALEAQRRDLTTAQADTTQATNPPAADPQAAGTTGDPASNATEGAQPSVMSQWVDELTGRRGAQGIRVPSDAEIRTLTSVFQAIPREEVVATLQRSPNLEAAVEALLQQAAQR